MSIKSLNNTTVRLIKTTQVISSVSSAVKELVENSIDANARSIEINLVDNGLTLIEVKDDGYGINEENSLLMGLPACTSKIQEFKDLETLRTYGFRGEALNAICQVAEVSVSTKIENEKAARFYKLNYDGTIASRDFTHRTTGTTVQMRNLLKNLPVRRTIISNARKQSQEIKVVENLLKSYAICQYSVRFNLRVNNKIIFTKSSCKEITEALTNVLGSKVVNNMACIQKTISQAEVKLIIPKNDVKDLADISQTGNQFITVNNRPIKSKEFSKVLNKRISDNFKQGTSLRFIYFMSIKTDPTLVDVNLEPNKDIVILQYKNEILDALDEILLNFYGLKDSQSSVNNSQTLNTDKRPNIDDSGNEWPACKKIKLNTDLESVCDVSEIEEFQTDKLSQSDYEFINCVKNPDLSDSDSNDEEFKRNGDYSKKNAPESELFDFCEDLQNSKNINEEETLSQLPKVDLGDDIDWVVTKTFPAQVKSKDNNLPCVKEKEEDRLPTLKAETDLIAWSRGKVPGLKGGITLEPPKFAFTSGVQKVENVTYDTCQDGKEPANDSELLDFCSDLPKAVGDEICTDVPVVDVGDDFEWQRVQPTTSNKMTPKVTPIKKQEKNSNRCAKKNLQGSSSILEQSNLSSWRINETSSTKLSEPKVLENLDLKINTEEEDAPIKGFSLFCREARPQIIKENPSLSIPAVANILSSRWKRMSPEERGYFRDCVSDKSPSTKSEEHEVGEKEIDAKVKEKNNKELIKILESMKTKRRDMKEGNMLMRTSYPFEVNISKVNEKFRRNATNQQKVENFVIGPVYPTIWVINYDSKLWVLDVKKFFDLLNSPDLDINKVTADVIEKHLQKWLNEKQDSSILRPFYTLTEQNQQS